MIVLAAVPFFYLRLMLKPASFWTSLNILGVTSFLPFVLVQPCDLMLVAMGKWRVLPVAVLHTIVLAWGSWSTMSTVSAISRLSRAQLMAGIALLAGTSIGIAGAVWR